MSYIYLLLILEKSHFTLEQNCSLFPSQKHILYTWHTKIFFYITIASSRVSLSFMIITFNHSNYYFPDKIMRWIIMNFFHTPSFCSRVAEIMKLLTHFFTAIHLLQTQYTQTFCTIKTRGKII